MSPVQGAKRVVGSHEAIVGGRARLLIWHLFRRAKDNLPILHREHYGSALANAQEGADLGQDHDSILT